jgi:hypothetical protein
VFASRADALKYVRAEGERAGAYRVFWERSGGRFVSEWLGPSSGKPS